MCGHACALRRAARARARIGGERARSGGDRARRWPVQRRALLCQRAPPLGCARLLRRGAHAPGAAAARRFLGRARRGVAVGSGRMNPREASLRLHLALGLAILAVMAWSFIEPRDRFTWYLEAAPVPIAAALIAWAYPRWRFTPLALALIAVHAAILLVGAKYTYAEVPPFNWLRDEYGLA